MNRRSAVALALLISSAACDGQFAFEAAAAGGSGGASASSGGSSGGFWTLGGAAPQGGSSGGMPAVGLGSSGNSGGAVAALLDCVQRCASLNLACSVNSYPTLTCIECIDNSSCEQFHDRPYCGSRNRCIGCRDNHDCMDRQVCVEDTHACAVRCDSENDSACAGLSPKPWCHVERGLCELCKSDDDCAGTPTTPHCDYLGVGCVACADDRHCSNGTVCDPVLHRCVKCEASSDCPVGQICDSETHACREIPVE
jgi:Cys-rich repeat protein